MHRGSSRRLALRVLLGVVGLLAVLRAVAPFWIQHAINRRLANIPDYGGHVGDIDLSLIRGAYRLNGLWIVKRSGVIREPFFAASSIDFSLAWRDLVHGKFVSDIIIDKGQLNFVQGPTRETSQLEADKRWQDVINDLFPIEITHLEIRNGVLRYLNTKTVPKVDMSIHNMHVTATGLRNRPSEKHEEYPAKLNLEGITIGDGRLEAFAEAEPLAEQPHFNLKLQLQGVSLPAMNEFLEAYGNVDVSKGTFEIYVEAGAKGGRYEGYVKPFFGDLQFKSVEDKHKALGKLIWERIVSAIAAVIRNRSKDQVATKIPFAGNFEKTDVGIWATVMNLLHNGFVKALNEGIEGTIRADDIKPAANRDQPSAQKPPAPHTIRDRL